MFLKRGEPYALVVGMAGVKMGDRFLQIGCADGGRLAAIAQKVGLSGRAVAVAPDEPSAARARKGAAPSIGIVSPVIQPARSDARNTIRSAISSAFPGRPSGCVVFERSRNAAYCSSCMPERR